MDTLTAPVSRRLTAWVGRVGLLALVWVLAGCSAVPQGAAPAQTQAQAGEQVCGNWVQRLDSLVDRAGARDGGAARVEGFPHARVNRLLVSWVPQARASEPGWLAWSQAAAALDREARTWELMNLPDAALRDLGFADRATVSQRLEDCALQAWAALAQAPAQRQALLARAQVPDDYATWRRTLGLYPLTRWPFYGGVLEWQDRWAAQLRQSPPPPEDPRPGIRWRPEGAALEPAAVTALVQAIQQDALGIPRPTQAQAAQLLRAYAPAIEVEQGGPFDRLGRLHWGDARAPLVDAARPTVYARVAHTRWGDRTLLQLVYSAWFSERPAEGPLDLLAGALDGVVMRLTLSPEGQPWLVDSIHACGCYHLFVPTEALQPRPAPRPGEEWAFAPIRLPALAPGERLLWRLSSGDHMVQGVDLVAAVPQRQAIAEDVYTLADEDGLRSLPWPGGGRRSLFAPDGIVPGTQRGERWLFWPMGIASPGAMRQWGRQPTAFVGRRHFDDPWLMDVRFERRGSPAP